MSRNGLAILRAVLQARAEAIQKFGPRETHDRPFVAKWVQRRVQAITGPEYQERTNYVDGEDL